MILEWIFSAFVGIIIGAIFQDSFASLFNTIKSFIKSFFCRFTKGDLCKAAVFNYGKRSTSVIIMDGNGKEAYEADNIKAIIYDQIYSESDYRTELEYFRKITDERLADRKAAGLSIPWNGKTLSLLEYRIERSASKGKMILDLSLALNEYYNTYSVITNLDQKCPETNRKLNQYIEDYDFTEPVGQYGLPNSVGICLQVITKDYKTIIARRSLVSGFRPEKYDASIVEGLNESDIVNGNIDFYSVAKRSVREEICDLEDSEIRTHLLGFLFDKHFNQWNVVGVVELTITHDEVVRRRNTGVSGRWELKELNFLTLSIKEVISFLSTHEIWDTGRAVVYFALVYKFHDRKIINKMIEKYQ